LRIETIAGDVVEDGRPKIRSDSSAASGTHQGRVVTARRGDFDSQL